ncbi:MAG TPA: ECF transporter S component [Oscillospiraceae bacterium]|nr:ECF transporter S component [Oscillospiraceae bacterium]HNW04199.1 ECF transporter S component [Oscillospiraceae bacterium]HPV99573.1 ECF transporter S component [Oscillospiraceae bacterium]
MEKKSAGKPILGEWNTRTAAAVAVGAVLFGVLKVWGSIPDLYFTAAMLVPIVAGALLGALPAGVSMFLGNCLADLIGGAGFGFDWSVGYGILGFCVGLLPLYGARIREGVFTMRQALVYAIVAVLANFVAFGLITPMMSSVFYFTDLEIASLQSLALGASNSAVLIVAGIPLLFLLARRGAGRGNPAGEE